MTQPSLLDLAPRFDGPGLTPSDQARLSGDLAKVYALMADGRWRTLGEIAAACDVRELSVGARVRDLRKAKFGGYDVPRQRRGQTWEYRLVDAR